MPEQTSIRISSDLLNALKSFKEEGDSYEDVIWDFIEPHLELSEQAKKDIELSKKEYENLKKETDEWQKEFVQYAHEEVVLELLPVIDNFSEAMAHVPASDQEKGWVTGITYIKKQLEDLLKNQSVELYGQVGDEFDPHLHEAVKEVKEEKSEPGKLIKVIRQGCKMKEKVVRPAQVVVSQ